MTDPFLQRLPSLSEAELRIYLARPEDYRPEAVAAASAELERRGLVLSDAEARAVEVSRTRVARPLGPSPGRMRTASGWVLGLGLGEAGLLYATARPPIPDPLVEDPMDSKRYLRELAVYGGQANVVVTQLREALAVLWEGRNRAYTVAALSILLAAGFRFLGREPRGLDG
jgi:hypothetical protein